MEPMSGHAWGTPIFKMKMNLNSMVLHKIPSLKNKNSWKWKKVSNTFHAKTKPRVVQLLVSKVAGEEKGRIRHFSEISVDLFPNSCGRDKIAPSSNLHLVSFCVNRSDGNRETWHQMRPYGIHFNQVSFCVRRSNGQREMWLEHCDNSIQKCVKLDF